MGFMHAANLDDGVMWPTAFALKDLTAAEEAKIGAREESSELRRVSLRLASDSGGISRTLRFSRDWPFGPTVCRTGGGHSVGQASP